MKILVAFSILLVTFTNYQFAKFIQSQLLTHHIIVSYPFALAIPWFLIALLPVLLFIKDSGITFESKYIYKNWKKLLVYVLIPLLGLLLFIVFGITKYFHTVKYPLIFFIITPIVEELIFRGWIFGIIKKYSRFSPVILTALLFGLHHLQYTNYAVTLFAIFQVTYTIFLGFFLGKIRQLSGSVYLGILMHILLNFLSFTL